MARPVSPLVEEAETEEPEGRSLCGGGERTPVTSIPSATIPVTHTPPGAATAALSRGQSFLRKCYPSASQQVPFLPSGHLDDCLPPCYHGAKAMAKLVK
ncbi:unnamed protein product, partial [Nesidiocoris tenuis]